MDKNEENEVRQESKGAAEERHEGRQKGLPISYYKKLGVTAFFVIAAVIVLIFAFVRAESVWEVIKKFASALAPVFVGAVFAYIMNPLMSFFDRKLCYVLTKRGKHIKKKQEASRVVSIVLTLLIVLLVFGFLVYLLVPELVGTISSIAPQMPEQTRKLQEWFDSKVVDSEELGTFVHTAVAKVSSVIEDFIENGLFNFTTGVLGSLFSGVWSVFGVLYNILVGLIFSVYFLTAKEKLLAQTKKMIYGTFKLERANRILSVTGQCHDKFTNAITGKIVDSVIVGLLCFIAMAIFGFPYAALISVVVGVTNVIPFFGPYMGAIPSAFLILFVDPMQCLWFIVMIVVLQQIDCNILTPRIVGGSIGLSPFWVLFACVVFGSLFGVVGMLLGVPVMGCIYMLVKEALEAKLKKKGLRTETSAYYDVSDIQKK